jgi:hypothetical protein
MIEPLEFEVDSYANLWKVRASCYLRDAERTFLPDRIVKADTCRYGCLNHLLITHLRMVLTHTKKS